MPTNIGEGSAKSSDKDFARFLEISLGSFIEVETELIIALNLKYLSLERYEELLNNIIEHQKMIYGFKKQLEK